MLVLFVRAYFGLCGFNLHAIESNPFEKYNHIEKFVRPFTMQ